MCSEAGTAQMDMRMRMCMCMCMLCMCMCVCGSAYMPGKSNSHEKGAAAPSTYCSSRSWKPPLGGAPPMVAAARRADGGVGGARVGVGACIGAMRAAPAARRDDGGGVMASAGVGARAVASRAECGRQCAA